MQSSSSKLPSLQECDAFERGLDAMEHIAITQEFDLMVHRQRFHEQLDQMPASRPEAVQLSYRFTKHVLFLPAHCEAVLS